MTSKRFFIFFLLSFIFCILFTGCRLTQSIRTDPSLHEQILSAYSAPEGLVGVARYYADRYQGRRTSSGEIFSQKKLTAAHPALPLGTRVKVENLANNKCVIVRINDRCREHEDVFIDLSKRAAKKLGFIREGKARVRITIVDDKAASNEHFNDEKHE